MTANILLHVYEIYFLYYKMYYNNVLKRNTNYVDI